MKFLTGVLLSTMCLTFSAASSANEGTILVERCAYSEGFIPSPQVQTDIPHPDGYTTKFYKGTSSYSSDESTYRVAHCMQNDLIRSLNLNYEKMSGGEKEAEAIKKKYEEFHTTYRLAGNNIFDNKNKIVFNFTNSRVKTQSREELCADLKGKYDTHPHDSSIKVDRYAFCMGTQVHQAPTCKNSHGDPCGTTYDKSRAGYTINKD
ncbi:hypothetical protein [Acinetobacter seifertii]|uniref:hypothetical protein n=1 Tax=Acinetobacter seifertii TaxID=1530123 RepID=UPI003EE39ACB